MEISGTRAVGVSVVNRAGGKWKTKTGRLERSKSAKYRGYMNAVDVVNEAGVFKTANK